MTRKFTGVYTVFWHQQIKKIRKKQGKKKTKQNFYLKKLETLMQYKTSSTERYACKTLFTAHFIPVWPFDPKIGSVHLCPKMHQWCKFSKKNLCNTYQVITLMSSKCCLQHILLHQDLALWPSHHKIRSFHLCPKMHYSAVSLVQICPTLLRILS